LCDLGCQRQKLCEKLPAGGFYNLKLEAMNCTAHTALYRVKHVMLSTVHTALHRVKHVMLSTALTALHRVKHVMLSTALTAIVSQCGTQHV